MGGKIGVDLDGTLAEYGGWQGPDHIGQPIPAMLERVQAWLAAGNEVFIFTARVCSTNPDADESRKAIEEWCSRHIGIVLPVSAEKDFATIAIYDDRAYHVEFNTGRV